MRLPRNLSSTESLHSLLASLPPKPSGSCREVNGFGQGHRSGAEPACGPDPCPHGCLPPTGNAAECTQSALPSQDGQRGPGRPDSGALRLRGPKGGPERKPHLVHRDRPSIPPCRSGLTLPFRSRRVVIRQKDFSTSESAESVICWTASHGQGAAEQGSREVRWVEAPALRR
jgi:hypothetical protein